MLVQGLDCQSDSLSRLLGWIGGLVFCFSFQFPDLLLEWLPELASVGPGIDAKLSSANLTSC